MAQTHELKCWPEFYEAIVGQSKTFDLRKNDRGFAVGDDIILREWEPNGHFYTGNFISRRISYILEHRPDAGCAATFGLREGYVILSLANSAQTEK